MTIQIQQTVAVKLQQEAMEALGKLSSDTKAAKACLEHLVEVLSDRENQLDPAETQPIKLSDYELLILRTVERIASDRSLTSAEILAALPDDQKPKRKGALSSIGVACRRLAEKGYLVKEPVSADSAARWKISSNDVSNSLEEL